MKERVTILGGHGLVGSRFVELFPHNNLLQAPTHREVDITNIQTIADCLKRYNSSVVINFAAYTKVDGAQEQKSQGEEGDAWKINVLGAENVARVAANSGVFLIHISTDFVFPGTEENPGPYSEDSPPAKKAEEIGWYGWTKLKGEEKVKEVGGRHCIVRISYPYRAKYEGKVDFARNILLLFDQGKLWPQFTDQTMTPSFIDEVCKVLILLSERKLDGIYHVGSSNTTNCFEFAKRLLKKARGATGVVKPGLMEAYLKGSGVAPRPRLGGFKSKKTQEVLGVSYNSWEEDQDDFIRQLK